MVIPAPAHILIYVSEQTEFRAANLYAELQLNYRLELLVYKG